MNTGALRKNAVIGTSVFIFFNLLVLTACAGNRAVPLTPFLPPTAVQNHAPLVLPLTTSPPAGPTTTPPCANNLLFLQDLTIPDNTQVAAGSPLDKQWLVQNNGTCNWDSRYRLRFIAGDPLGAPAEQALYPARAGAQATLRILFTAPSDPGTYTSEWQAYDPSGTAFGVSFFMKIVIGP